MLFFFSPQIMLNIIVLSYALHHKCSSIATPWQWQVQSLYAYTPSWHRYKTKSDCWQSWPFWPGPHSLKQYKYSLVQWIWFSVTGCTWIFMHSDCDVREPILLHQAVHHSNTEGRHHRQTDLSPRLPGYRRRQTCGFSTTSAPTRPPLKLSVTTCQWQRLRTPRCQAMHSANDKGTPGNSTRAQ